MTRMLVTVTHDELGLLFAEVVETQSHNEAMDLTIERRRPIYDRLSGFYQLTTEPIRQLHEPRLVRGSVVRALLGEPEEK